MGAHDEGIAIQGPKLLSEADDGTLLHIRLIFEYILFSRGCSEFNLSSSRGIPCAPGVERQIFSKVIDICQ